MKKTETRISEELPLKWPDGQERTLIDRRKPRAPWKKTFRQYAERMAIQLGKLGIEQAVISFNPAPLDRQDPGVTIYFSRPMKEDYSWQVALGLDTPMPTLEQIKNAFNKKARIHHPDSDSVRQGQGDVKLFYQYDEHRKKAIEWVTGKHNLKHEYAIACDRCTEPRWNLEAIRRILMAVTVMDEFGNPGTLERTFRGFKTALPAHASSEVTNVE